ncbi:hypothetical protein MMC21_007802 [Puttea exsequens]|nr:hypothetical protein [Puttea exsequens]
MSATATSDILNSSSTTSKSRKSKKKKGSRTRPNGDNKDDNGTKAEAEDDAEQEEDADKDAEKEVQESRTPIEPPSSPRKVEANHIIPLTNGLPTRNREPPDKSEDVGLHRRSLSQGQGGPPTNGLVAGQKQPADTPESTPAVPNVSAEALEKERDALREEVAQIRQSLADIQKKHVEELGSFEERLTAAQSEKEQAESQYRGLLGKVNTIRSQLGERLKADAEDLSQARSRIEELEEQNGTLKEENEARIAELALMAEEGEQRSKELSGLRNRTTLSTQNWTKERDDLIQREAYAKEEFEAAKQAMQDWEILAMEERSIRESIQEKFTELEEQVESHREAYERAASERDSQSTTVDGLQRALQEIQDARRRELREVVENSQSQIESLQKRLREVESSASEATAALESTKQELERAVPFEKEVKEKNLLIGKLRHELVIMNDHFTKALKTIKSLRKGKPEDNVDKELVTNHILRFLALERSDPKKFEVLQLMANLLDWSEEQREQAGLARPGASNPSLRVPISPWHRTPSTPALSAEFFPEGGTKKESLAELWSEFLEQEAQEGDKTPKSPGSSSAGVSRAS